MGFSQFSPRRALQDEEARVRGPLVEQQLHQVRHRRLDLVRLEVLRHVLQIEVVLRRFHEFLTKTIDFS